MQHKKVNFPPFLCGDSIIFTIFAFDIRKVSDIKNEERY